MLKSKKNNTLDEYSLKSNRINHGTKIKGEINAEGNIRIDGEIEGDIICKAKLVIGEEAKIIGNIDAQNAEIIGDVKGNITVKELLVLKQGANVKGDLFSDKITIESGAVFNGSSNMGINSHKSNEKNKKEELIVG